MRPTQELYCESGEIVFKDGNRKIGDFPWNEHPAFAGVSLKHLLTGNDTDGNFSCHLVRVAAGCKIGNHIHEGKWELHEVLCGQGICQMGSVRIPYQPGVVAAIPADVLHEVQADEEIYLLAKFVPALL